MKTSSRNFAILICAVLSIQCSSIKTKTAQDIVEASIKFHDPKNKWANLNAEFLFESKFSFNDSVPEELQVTIDVQKNDFQYHNLDRKVNIQYPQESCIILQGEGTCEGYRWTKNFYTYVWGLPMKLQDSEARIQEGFSSDTINNIPLNVVAVHYENENFKFYFDQKSSELKFFSFIKNNAEKHGEFIELRGLFEYNEIKFPAVKEWRESDSKKLIGTNEVITIKSKN